ncbi:MAG: hypothetical protein AB1813_29090, partial [Verrucomicrobiota bacterium]
MAARCIQNNHRAPVPDRVDLFALPYLWWRYTHNKVGGGRAPAKNLQPAGASEDFSRVDPMATLFWNPPGAIADQDLYHGFGRSKLPDWEGTLWNYAAPKTSYGNKPGFEIAAGDVTLKVKFGEIHSEPFTARIFHALGFHAEPTDYSPGLRVKYDRRIFREFNLRRPMRTKICLLGIIPLQEYNFQPYADPFEYVAHAVLKDGSRISNRELKKRLFRNATRPRPEANPANFRIEFEQTIDHLMTIPANVQWKDDRVRSLGPWDFEGLDHPHRRELRGLCLLAAWVGWYDSRFDNTRVKRVKDASESANELRFFVTDLGGGMGEASTWLFKRKGESPNHFKWDFTQTDRSGRFRVKGFEPIERTPAFEQMTLDDARWMGR